MSPRKLDGKTDWYEVQRIATGLAVVGLGAGHAPVSLSASAETVMTIGEGDEPQEITLDIQAANTAWMGPTTGSAVVPAFRLFTEADLVAASVVGVPAFTFATTAAEGTSASLVRIDAQVALFDVTVPTTISQGDTAAVGSASGATRYDHAHGINTSYNPASAACILASATDGGLQLVRLGIGTDPDTDNAIKVVDDTWIGLGAAAGRVIFDSTPNPDQIQLAAADLYLPASHGVIHADGVSAGQVLKADGTRFIPGTMSASDLDNVAFGVPNLTLGTSNVEGSSASVIRVDATILAFDATNPVTLTASTAAATGAATVAARRDHAHAITSSADPGAAASILASAADGGLELLRLGIGADPDTNNRITMVDGGQIGDTGEPLVTFDNTNDYLEIMGCDVGIGSSTPPFRLYVLDTDAATNTITTVAGVTHNTTNTAADLFGAAFQFSLESSTTGAQAAAHVTALWSDATHASRNALMRLNTFPAGSALGYFGIWSGNDIDDVAQTAIPGGAGDVTGYLWVRYVVVESAGGTNSDVAELAPGDGAHTIYTDGVDTFTLTVAAGGDVTLVRTVGESTIDVMLLMAWI